MKINNYNKTQTNVQHSSKNSEISNRKEVPKSHAQIPEKTQAKKPDSAELIAQKNVFDSDSLKKSRIQKSVLTANAAVKTTQATPTFSVDSKARVAVNDALRIDKLKPVGGTFGSNSPDLFIVDNPETFSKPGVLGSTIAPVKGRSTWQNAPNVHWFTDSARAFSLSNNGTGAAQRFQVVLKNNSDHPIDITAEGVQYAKGNGNTLGIPEGYLANPPKDAEFRGPQAIAAQSYMNHKVGENGYVSISKTNIQPGETVVLTNKYQDPGAEIFSLLNINATRTNEPNFVQKLFGQDKPNQFSLAVVATPETLTSDQLKKFSDLEAAGVVNRADGKSDFAGSDKQRLGRPNGVITRGSNIYGSTTVDVSKGETYGQLLMSTKFKNAGTEDEIGKISKVLPNPATTIPIIVPGIKEKVQLGSPSVLNDTNYGATYNLDYELSNPSNETKSVQVLLTSPTTGQVRNPDGGEFTHPVKINGQNVQLRLDHAGEGRIVADVTLPPNSKQTINLQLTNFGNTYPPIGIEFRPK